MERIRHYNWEGRGVRHDNIWPIHVFVWCALAWPNWAQCKIWNLVCLKWMYFTASTCSFQLPRANSWHTTLQLPCSSGLRRNQKLQQMDWLRASSTVDWCGMLHVLADTWWLLWTRHSFTNKTGATLEGQRQRLVLSLQLNELEKFPIVQNWKQWAWEGERNSQALKPFQTENALNMDIRAPFQTLASIAFSSYSVFLQPAAKRSFRIRGNDHPWQWLFWMIRASSLANHGQEDCQWVALSSELLIVSAFFFFLNISCGAWILVNSDHWASLESISISKHLRDSALTKTSLAERAVLSTLRFGS